MASSMFCKINTGYYGIKKTSQEHLQRKYSLSPTLRYEQRPFLSCRRTQRCYGKVWTNTFSSKQENDRRENLLKCGGDNGIALTEEETVQTEELSRETLIWRAIKIPIYTVAWIPVTVGTAAAYYQTGSFSFGRYFKILLYYVIVNVWFNLSNDVYDFDTGADVNKRESVVNLFGSRTGINVIAWSLLVLGAAGFISLAIEAESLRSLLFLAAGVFFLYFYQVPPFRLSYHGLGEPLLFSSFGPLCTIAFYLLNSVKGELPISGTIVWSSVLVGFTTTLILFISHFHQTDDDKAAGKIGPLVRLGTETGSTVLKMAVVGLYSLVLALGFTQNLPFASVILCAMTLPMGSSVVSYVAKNHKDKTKIFMGKYVCARLHTAFGLALAAGLVFARKFAVQPVPLDIPL